MACGSGCCGPSTPVSPESSVHKGDESCDDSAIPMTTDNNLSQSKPTDAACGSGCCAPPTMAVPDRAVHADIDGKESLASLTSYQNAPCSVPSQERNGACEKESTKGDACVDEKCCAPVPTETECDKDCCSTPKAPQLDEPAPSCCEGETAPCCDQSCLDRLALRECENGSDYPLPPSGCKPDNNGKPCREHARKARDTYAGRLEALGCICRALIALGQESCCSPQRRSSASIRRRSKAVILQPRASIDSCCAPKTRSARVSVDSCCANKNQPQAGDKRRGQAGKAGISRPVSAAGSCGDSCCAQAQQPSPVEHAIEISPSDARVHELEKGFSFEKREHVVISIAGMTCTGCETKLNRTLGSHPRVQNLKTSLILSRAEFDLMDAASADEVMKHVERTTEFKCEKITLRGSTLSLIAPNSDAAAFADQPWPEGVFDVKITNKETVEVNFDPSIIGARDLFERGWGGAPVRLAPLRPDPTLEASSKHVRHVGFMTLLSTCLTIPVLVIAWAPLPEHEVQYASASLALATVVQFVVAGPFYPKALKAFIFSKVIEMDLLIVLSTSAAYIFSLVSFGYMVSGQPLSTGSFFETSTLLVTLIMVGRWVSAFTRQKAVESISIRSLQSQSTYLVTDSGEIEIDTRLLQYGDVFKVVPDSRIPTDGTVISGSSEVNESMLTGESRPVEKHSKSPVIAGSINGSGTLNVRLTRLPGDNTISTIAAMVDEAKLSKPKLQALADCVASYFVPVIVLMTIITFCIWIAIGIKLRGQTGSEATIQAITYAITVLIVSCPCAIGLAVPMVIVIASGVAAQRGVIFKSAEAIEIAFKTSHVVLDKTGTVTEGKLAVTREWYDTTDRGVTQSMLLGLVGGIKHPVSVAVAKCLKEQGVKPCDVLNAKTVTGKGVEGTAKDSGFFLRAGNSRWLNMDSHAEAQSALLEGYTTFCFTVDGSLAAILGLTDSIRPDAPTTINTLLDHGISVHLISGDDIGAVRNVAAQLNIAEANVRSNCTPADKRAYIEGLLQGSVSPSSTKERASKTPIVLFCGDGTNDAVAIAQATIGVHINEGGTDVAQSAADVVLMRPDLAGILTAIKVSRKSFHRIIFNFGWSFVYNLFAILLAAGAFVNVRIPPEFAGLGEIVSVLPVIIAALLLRWARV